MSAHDQRPTRAFGRQVRDELLTFSPLRSRFGGARPQGATTRRPSTTCGRTPRAAAPGGDPGEAAERGVPRPTSFRRHRHDCAFAKPLRRSTARRDDPAGERPRSAIRLPLCRDETVAPRSETSLQYPHSSRPCLPQAGWLAERSPLVPSVRGWPRHPWSTPNGPRMPTCCAFA